ncbi:vWA domain-containing protein [Paraliomyxa miuraensis]|uniref:vWA domain-containing protein n=1 Tax=Paraliomyxa miuraensis TaxID=376150 RepID=UPI002250068D|nr:VWA domain-containing protein [Paraliomyxa miuraensis]MCX4242206.1 VWA domain-containing protein [Paraliomyxa miuraensis]
MRLRTLPVLLLVAAALVPACTPNRAHLVPPVAPGAPVVPAPEAAAVQPIELEVTGDLANRFVEAGRAGEVLARIRIHSPESRDTERPRANIGLVVDTSGSMEGDAIVQARAAALTLLGDLRDGDVLSVITFGSSPQVLVPATVLDAKTRPTIRTDMERMKATGTTDLAGGLAAGLQQVQSQARQGEINRIVLVSDGVPNDEAPIMGLAQQARNVGVPITALGLGLEYHETLLGQIAANSGGKFHFVEDPTKVASVFREEVLSIDRLAARAVALTLTPGPGVAIVDVPGFSIGYSGRSAVLGLPDLAEGDTQQVIVRLAVSEHRDGATVELLDGVVTYADARTSAGMERRTFVSARATADAEELAKGVDLDVSVAAARATTAAATLQIVSMARAGDVKGAQAMLDRTLGAGRTLSETMPDAELARLLDDLVELRPTLPGLAPQPVAVDRRSGAKGKTGSIAMGVDEAPQPVPTPSPASARGVRASHERAYKVLHGN